MDKQVVIYIVYSISFLLMLGILYQYFKGDRQYVLTINKTLDFMKKGYHSLDNDVITMRENASFYKNRIGTFETELSVLSQATRNNHTDIMLVKKKLFDKGWLKEEVTE